MFVTPYNLSVSLWFKAVPEFETVTEPVVQPDGCDAGAADGASDVAPTGADTRTRVVLKGMRWIACPVWSARINPQWEQAAQDRRLDDEEQARDRSRMARQPSTPDGVAAAERDDGVADGNAPADAESGSRESDAGAD